MPSIDLKDINGIGSKTVETLKAANIRTIKQLSTISVAELESLDGIGPAKAKQFINEAKKKLNSTDGRTQLKDQSFVGPKRSILQEINAKIEKIHSRLENFDRRIEFIGNNLDLSREGNRKGEEDRNIRKTSALTQLKAEIINEIKDPEFFKNLIKEGIQNYLQKDQLPNKNQEIKTEKLMQLQEQVKILEQKFSSLATSFKSQQWSDKGDESSSAQAVERKNKPPIELKTSVDLEAATNTLTKPKKAPLQKSKTSDKKNASEPQVTIKKPIQNLEDRKSVV